MLMNHEHLGWHVLRLAMLLCKQREVGSIPTRSTADFTNG